MERLREKVRNYWSSGFQKYRSLCLIPGTTSYRDIQHEDDVTTSCAHYLTSQSCNDAVDLTSQSCNDDVKIMTVSCVSGDDDNAGGEGAKKTK